MIGIDAVVSLAVVALIYRSGGRYPDLSTWWNAEGILIALIGWVILASLIFSH
jgi:hypothetical protein